MKFLFSFILLLSISKECNNNSSSSEVNQLQEVITFEYSALSKGYYTNVKISESTILVQKDRNSKAISKVCSKDDWSELMYLLDAIDLKYISELEAPTEARLYDGAAIAQLIITQENVSFETKSFDHGKPPLEIEALVKKILSLSENIE